MQFQVFRKIKDCCTFHHAQTEATEKIFNQCPTVLLRSAATMMYWATYQSPLPCQRLTYKDKISWKIQIDGNVDTPFELIQPCLCIVVDRYCTLRFDNIKVRSRGRYKNVLGSRQLSQSNDCQSFR